MTTDLWMLAAGALLYFLQILAAAVPSILMRGMGWAAGPRDGTPEPVPAWVDRLDRAQKNMQENLITFAIVVLVVHVSGQANATSANGAMLWLGCRVLHPLLYVAGIPHLRTASWAVSLIGLAMVASALF